MTLALATKHPASSILKRDLLCLSALGAFMFGDTEGYGQMLRDERAKSNKNRDVLLANIRSRASMSLHDPVTNAAPFTVDIYKEGSPLSLCMEGHLCLGKGGQFFGQVCTKKFRNGEIVLTDIQPHATQSRPEKFSLMISTCLDFFFLFGLLRVI